MAAHAEMNIQGDAAILFGTKFVLPGSDRFGILLAVSRRLA
jgi:hypothetical protein